MPCRMESLATRYVVQLASVKMVSATVALCALIRKRIGFMMKLEAPPGFEPGVEVLQTSALPLGDGARWGRKNGAGNGIRTRDFDLGKVALYH